MAPVDLVRKGESCLRDCFGFLWRLCPSLDDQTAILCIAVFLLHSTCVAGMSVRETFSHLKINSATWSKGGMSQPGKKLFTALRKANNAYLDLSDERCTLFSDLKQQLQNRTLPTYT